MNNNKKNPLQISIRVISSPKQSQHDSHLGRPFRGTQRVQRKAWSLQCANQVGISWLLGKHSTKGVRTESCKMMERRLPLPKKEVCHGQGKNREARFPGILLEHEKWPWSESEPLQETNPSVHSNETNGPSDVNDEDYQDKESSKNEQDKADAGSHPSDGNENAAPSPSTRAPSTLQETAFSDRSNETNESSEEKESSKNDAEGIAAPSPSVASIQNLQEGVNNPEEAMMEAGSSSRKRKASQFPVLPLKKNKLSGLFQDAKYVEIFVMPWREPNIQNKLWISS